MPGQVERLVTTMALMERDNDNEALVALRAATKMLKARGLTWSDLARDVLDKAATPTPAPAATTWDQAFAGFGDIFSQMRPQTPPAPPAPRARPSRILQGREIPEHLTGTVRISDERTTRKGDPYLVVDIDTGDTLCSPVMVFDQAVITLIRDAGSALVRFRIQPPRPGDPRGNPIVRTASHV